MSSVERTFHQQNSAFTTLADSNRGSQRFLPKCISPSSHSPDIVSYRDIKAAMREQKNLKSPPTALSPEIQKVLGDLKFKQMCEDQSDFPTRNTQLTSSEPSTEFAQSLQERRRERSGSSTEVRSQQFIKQNKIVNELNTIQLQVRTDLAKRAGTISPTYAQPISTLSSHNQSQRNPTNLFQNRLKPEINSFKLPEKSRTTASAKQSTIKSPTSLFTNAIQSQQFYRTPINRVRSQTNLSPLEANVSLKKGENSYKTPKANQSTSKNQQNKSVLQRLMKPSFKINPQNSKEQDSLFLHQYSYQGSNFPASAMYLQEKEEQLSPASKSQNTIHSDTNQQMIVQRCNNNQEKFKNELHSETESVLKRRQPFPQTISERNSMNKSAFQTPLARSQVGENRIHNSEIKINKKENPIQQFGSSMSNSEDPGPTLSSMEIIKINMSKFSHILPSSIKEGMHKSTVTKEIKNNSEIQKTYSKERLSQVQEDFGPDGTHSMDSVHDIFQILNELQVKQPTLNKTERNTKVNDNRMNKMMQNTHERDHHGRNIEQMNPKNKIGNQPITPSNIKKRNPALFKTTPVKQAASKNTNNFILNSPTVINQQNQSPQRVNKAKNLVSHGEIQKITAVRVGNISNLINAIPLQTYTKVAEVNPSQKEYIKQITVEEGKKQLRSQYYQRDGGYINTDMKEGKQIENRNLLKQQTEKE